MKLRRKFTGQFKDDYKKAMKQRKPMELLEDDNTGVMNLIISRKPIPPKLKDHPLQGKYKGSRELHLQPDWLLIYRTTETEAIFERLGTHSELFKK